MVCALLQAVTSLIWRPLKAHKLRGVWDVGHHWLGRASFVLAIAAMFTGIYIAAVGWGYHVAYGATIAMFLVLMAMKDVIDIFMVSPSLLSHQACPTFAAPELRSDTAWKQNAHCTEWDRTLLSISQHRGTACSSDARYSSTLISVLSLRKMNVKIALFPAVRNSVAACLSICRLAALAISCDQHNLAVNFASCHMVVSYIVCVDNNNKGRATLQTVVRLSFAFCWQGHKLKSVSVELAKQRRSKKGEPAVAQTTDVVTSHTGDKWTENSGGLYPYLKTKRGKVNKGQDNVHSSVQLPAPKGNPGNGLEMANTVENGTTNGHADPQQMGNGVTLV